MSARFEYKPNAQPGSFDVFDTGRNIATCDIESDAALIVSALNQAAKQVEPTPLCTVCDSPYHTTLHHGGSAGA